MVIINSKTCTGCGLCVKDCISNALSLENGKAAYSGQCISCGHCAAICPSSSVSLPDYDMADVEEYDNRLFDIDPDKLLRSIKFRRSVRDYEDKKIPVDIIEKLLNAGRYTATGSNRQGCRFVFVQDQLQTLRDLVWQSIEAAVSNPEKELDWFHEPMTRFLKMRSESGTDYLFRNAPCVLYIAADSSIDAGLAAQNMEMLAAANGLGALYNGFLVRAASLAPETRDWLKVSDRPIQACMLLGYPNVKYQRTAPRRKADAVLL